MLVGRNIRRGRCRRTDDIGQPGLQQDLVIWDTHVCVKFVAFLCHLV